jgi:hypothetical protein
MNNRLFLEEIRDRAKQQAKNNIKIWIKWGFFLLFLFLSVVSLMSIVVISAFKQTVSFENFEEMGNVTNTFLQGNSNGSFSSSINDIIPYYDYLIFAINNTEILGLISIVLSVLFLILSFLFLKIKIKK